MSNAAVKPEERRIATRCRIETEVGMETDTNFYGGLAFDISTGGLFVTMFERLPALGEEVEVQFTVPNGPAIQVRAVVRWRRSGDDAHSRDLLPGVGVQFLDLPEGCREGIERFVAGREPILFEA